MRVPEEVLQSVRSRVSIVDVIERHIALKRAGKNWVGLCPFHAEKTPSFVVNEDRGTYHCFGCGAGGTVFRFLMDIQGEPFVDVVRSLAKEAGVPFASEPESPRARSAREERELLYEVLSAAATYYRHQLLKGRAGERARGYLVERQIPEETAESFALGCAPQGWDNLTRYLRKKGFDLGVAARAGLVGERQSGGYYDRLRDRLVFPITDTAGRVVSFGGRVLGEGEPKYLNGPETAVFHKGELLYGTYQGRENLRRGRKAILVEGYLDVISLHARGFGAAVATLGTSLTAQHIQALRRRVDEVVLLYDGDSAGRAAAFRGLDLFLGEGFPCAGVLLPDGEDPDSFVRQGGDLAGLLGSAQSLFELFLRDVEARTDLRTVEGKLAAVEEVVPRLAAISDPMALGLYVKRVADALGLDESHLRDRVGAGRRPVRRRGARTGSPSAPRSLDPLEIAILKSLVTEPEHRAIFLSRQIESWMRDGPVRDAALFVAGRKEDARSLPVDEAPEAARQVLTEALVECGGPLTKYVVLEARLRLRDLEHRANRIVADIRRAEEKGDHSAVLDLLRKKGEIDRALSACRRTASSKTQ